MCLIIHTKGKKNFNSDSIRIIGRPDNWSPDNWNSFLHPVENYH